jgi:hypothetical protein
LPACTQCPRRWALQQRNTKHADILRGAQGVRMSNRVRATTYSKKGSAAAAADTTAHHTDTYGGGYTSATVHTSPACTHPHIHLSLHCH